MTLTIVDLPAPLCPTRPTHSPGRILMVTPSSALTAPKLTLASATSMTASRSGIAVITVHSRKKGRFWPVRRPDRTVSWEDTLFCFRYDLFGISLRILDVGDATFLGVGQIGFQRVLTNAEEGNDEILLHFLTVENLLGNPEGER